MTPKIRRIETRFTRALNGLIKILEDTVRYPQTPQDVTQGLQHYAQSPEYQSWCDEMAFNMTAQVNESVNAVWRQSALKAGRGNEFYTAILAGVKAPPGGAFSQIVRENANMIKALPLDISRDMTAFIARESAKGRRTGDILTDLIEKFPNTAKTRLQLIARTEVSKTQSALTQARAFSLGIEWYIWRTSEDARVRSAHRHMEGILVNYLDPPSPEALFPKKGVKPYGHYHAGMTMNCRCYAEPHKARTLR